MAEEIPVNRESLLEATELAGELLRKIEMSELSLGSLALMASRLARLLNDFEHQKIFEYENSGYPTTPNGVTPEVWKYAEIAGRKFQIKDSKAGEIKEYIYQQSISELEQSLEISKQSLIAAKDPDISISSANPNQYVHTPMGNVFERSNLKTNIAQNIKRLSERRAYLYSYVLEKFYELKFSGIAGDVFSKARGRVDSLIGKYVPDAIQKFTSVHENLISENPEDWSNAVHSCRRILNELANTLYPPREEAKEVQVDGKQQKVNLGVESYINRLVAYVEENKSSERYEELVGSHLKYLGERLDSIYKASTKGSHSVVHRQEAERYVIYTYLLVSDILSLGEE